MKLPHKMITDASRSLSSKICELDGIQWFQPSFEKSFHWIWLLFAWHWPIKSSDYLSTKKNFYCFYTKLLYRISSLSNPNHSKCSVVNRGALLLLNQFFFQILQMKHRLRYLIIEFCWSKQDLNVQAKTTKFICNGNFMFLICQIELLLIR